MPPRDQKREQRILDAMARLIERFGYNKTTVADIANEAGISKGAMYLHFKSKEEAFEALLISAMFAFSKAWINAVEEDPDGGLIANMYINMLKAFDQVPFMATIMRKDPATLGNYLKKPGNFFEEQQSAGMRHEFIALMQQAGAVRKDLDPLVTAHIMDIISYGLVTAADYKPKDQVPETDALIRGIADMMSRTLTPPDGGNSDAGKQIIRKLYAQGLEQFEQQLREKNSK